MKHLFVFIILVFFAVPSAFAETVSYQGVTVQPGDVFNFHKGPVVTWSQWFGIKPQSYGHSGMYLGQHPDTGRHYFLDFSMDNKTYRICEEMKFLDSNAKLHSGFDIFRLQGDQKLEPKPLYEAARRIVDKGYWLLGETKHRENCASAIAYVLSQVTERDIRASAPEDFVSGDFKRHPQLVNKSINMKIALDEASPRHLKALLREAETVMARKREVVEPKTTLAGTTWVDTKNNLWNVDFEQGGGCLVYRGGTTSRGRWKQTGKVVEFFDEGRPGEYGTDYRCTREGDYCSGTMNVRDVVATFSFSMRRKK